MMFRQRAALLTVLTTFAALVALAVGATTASSAIKQTIGSYTVDLPLSQPTTLGPVNGVTLSYPADPLKLSWRAVPGAKTYDVQIAAQPSSSVNCSTTTAWQADNIILTYNTPELGWVPELTDKQHGSDIWTGTYCFRVRAAGTVPGVWSDGSRFTLTWTAQASNLRFYSDESGDVPRAAGTAGDANGFDTGYLEWDPVAGATQYEIQISKATTFGPASIFAEKIYPATRLLLPQMPDNQYTWRVRPITSTGIKGSWSSSATFRIFHDDRYWGGSANGTSNTLYPPNNSTQDDVRMGWEPVPGASYYRYMALSLPTSFGELPNMDPFGKFANEETCSGEVDGRISATEIIDSSTVNNWVTFGGLFAPDVVKKLTEGCTWDPTPPNPVTGVDADTTDDETVVFPDLPEHIYWRVYPVWTLSKATEQGWNISRDEIIPGKAIERKMTPLEYDPAAPDSHSPVDNDGCYAMNDNMVDCIRNVSGGLSPLNPSTTSTTMQVPYFEWGKYPGWNFGLDDLDPTKGPGSFHVQIAQDPQFVFPIFPGEVNPTQQFRGWLANLGPERFDKWGADSKGLTRFGSITRSFALTTGLPDEGDDDGNGYFWRSIPCTSPGKDFECRDLYKFDTDDQHSFGIRYGQPDSGALEFKKRVEVSTAVINGFTPTTPMLRVGPVGASSYSDWQRGIQGADHYEFQLARSLAFDDSGARTYKTTVPRIVPWGATPSDVIEPGTWFWRVRAVDRDGLQGSWSAASSFTASAAAPAISNSSATIGVGGTVEWSPVTGAIGYEIEWSPDSGFATDVTKQVTRQTAYYVPATAAGSLYWRVRAQTGGDATGATAGVFGQWSDPRAITILSPSGITYGVARNVVNVGQTAIIEGTLVVAGSTRNSQVVTLQRKTSSCSGGGTYRSIANQTSGRNLDDGMVRYRIRIAASYCYRLMWSFATGALYSAPFEVGAKPIVSFKPLQRTVRRGRAFCSRITSRQALTGTLRIQYRVGRTWVTAKTQPVRGMKRRTQCAAINRGGVFPVRLVISNLVNPSTGWKTYEDVTLNGGTVKTADSFVIIRQRR